MKIELGIRTREIQRDWYGKRGISLNGFMVIAHRHSGTIIFGARTPIRMLGLVKVPSILALSGLRLNFLAFMYTYFQVSILDEQSYQIIL